jgi:signal transduction histidine kinase
MASEGLVETRRAISALRADALPLEQELARATATSADRYGVTATLQTEGAPRPVPPDATLALLRVAQEALVNAAKHAPGQPVAVHLEYGPGDIRLTVRNDLLRPVPSPEELSATELAGAGSGAHVVAAAGPEAGAGWSDKATAGGGAGISTADTRYGLTSMRERLRLLNGALDVGPGDGQWTVSAWLPLAPADEPPTPAGTPDPA